MVSLTDLVPLFLDFVRSSEKKIPDTPGQFHSIPSNSRHVGTYRNGSESIPDHSECFATHFGTYLSWVASALAWEGPRLASAGAPDRADFDRKSQILESSFGTSLDLIRARPIDWWHSRGLIRPLNPLKHPMKSSMISQ